MPLTFTPSKGKDRSWYRGWSRKLLWVFAVTQIKTLEGTRGETLEDLAYLNLENHFSLIPTFFIHHKWTKLLQIIWKSHTSYLLLNCWLHLSRCLPYSHNQHIGKLVYIIQNHLPSRGNIIYRVELFVELWKIYITVGNFLLEIKKTFFHQRQ